jgi:hypothetical protein
MSWLVDLVFPHDELEEHVGSHRFAYPRRLQDYQAEAEMATLHDFDSVNLVTSKHSKAQHQIDSFLAYCFLHLQHGLVVLETNCPHSFQEPLPDFLVVLLLHVQGYFHMPGQYRWKQTCQWTSTPLHRIVSWQYGSVFLPDELEEHVDSRRLAYPMRLQGCQAVAEMATVHEYDSVELVTSQHLKA